MDVPAVIESKDYNEMAPMIDEDLKRRVEEFIAKFKRQLCLERQQSLSFIGLASFQFLNIFGTLQVKPKQVRSGNYVYILF